jgi:hypothetical protein
MAIRKTSIHLPVEGRILVIRGLRVLLDEDLAALYGVSVKRLNEQVLRNKERFPKDFRFQLSSSENMALRSQSATSKKGRGGRRYAPFAFTEHGAIMAASVLNSPQAVEMSVFIVRAFVRLREMLATNAQLAAKLVELEGKLGNHDDAIRQIVAAIKTLMKPPTNPSRRIGFQSEVPGSKTLKAGAGR